MRQIRYLVMGLTLLAAAAKLTPALAAPSRQPTGRALVDALPEVQPKGSLRSTVPMVVGMELSWAKQQLQERIPEQLHQESNREVTRGISLDISVRRRGIDLRTQEDRVTLATELLLDLDVRSKLGSFAAHLGTCRAVVDVEFALRLRLSPEGRLSPPVGKATIREPCRLAGFDLTPVMEREIDQRLASSQQQANEYLANINHQLSQLYSELTRRLGEPGSECVGFLPDKLLQSPIVEEQGVVTTWFALEGTVSNSCDTVLPAPLVVEPVATAPGFDLAWSRRITAAELRELIGQRLHATRAGGTLVKLRSVRLDDTDQLALFVRVSKREGWIFAQPRIADNRLGLHAVRSKDNKLLGLVKADLESFSLPVEATPVEALANRLIAVANETTIVVGSSPSLKDRYQILDSELLTTSEVLVDRDALIVVVRRNGRGPTRK